MVRRGSYLWYEITRPRHIDPPYWRIAYMDRKRMREIYYFETDDPLDKALWRMLMRAYYHKMSEKEIMEFLVYYRGYSEKVAHELIEEIKKDWLGRGFIEVKEK